MASESVIDIGGRLEPFVDHFLIDRLDGAQLRLHHPQPAGVAFRFDQPWEGAGSAYCTVLDDGPKRRLYYRGWRSIEDHYAATACMAESDDGLTFHRPDLGLFEVNGTRQNNVILAGELTTHNFAPMLDERPGVPPDERYKALARNAPQRFLETTEEVGLIPFASADGINWRRLADEPVITAGAFDSQNVPFWSTHEGCYLCYFRIFAEGKRSVARTRSDDFLHWDEPVPMQYGDTPLEQLYTNQTTPYFRAPHIYLATPGRFMPGRQVLPDDEGEALGINHSKGKGRWYDCADAVLMTSRGGDLYDRTFMESFVRPGLDRRNWTTRCNYPARGIVQTGEAEMSIFIERHNSHDSKYLERLSMRLDGFASVSAGYDGGQVTTKPLTFTGSRLVLNYATSAAGHVRLAILDEAGAPVPGHTFDDSPQLIGDEIARAVQWPGETTPLADRPIRLAFELKDADLYSLQVIE